jgi:pimeloyl-ACP methyl ester carboxylesterase
MRLASVALACAAALVAVDARADLTHESIDGNALQTVVAVDARADLTHESIDGNALQTVELGGVAVSFADLETPKAPGKYTLSWKAAGDAIRIPHCGSRGKVTVDGVVKDAGSKGPLIVKVGPGEHRIEVEIEASKYEKRIACGERPRMGQVISTKEGLTLLRFPSTHKHADAGQAVVFVPKGHDTTKPGPLLVGVHPWNGSPWTYAAYRELLEEAQDKDVVLVMPSGLGNSLYTADAEDEVMLAIAAIEKEVAIDPQRVSIWGASMGGAGATTISFHHPDKFAFVASYFGDSKYDLTTYVKNIFGGEANAKKVNCLDVLENARHLSVFLVHGEIDTTSPIRQSEMLDDAMKKAGFKVDFVREPGMGHEGALVAKYLRRVVDRAADARAPTFPARVTFRSVRASDDRAYGVRIVRAGEGDAYVDLEGRTDGVHVLKAEGVSQIVLTPGALSTLPNAAIHRDPSLPVTVDVKWGP